MKKIILAGITYCASLSYGQGAPLSLTGTVAIINTAVITPLAEAVNLNILGGEVDRLVANVAETSNNPTGYRVLMSSVNGSQLVNTSNSAAKVDYTISYDRRPRITLTRNDQEVKRVTNLTGLTTNNSEVRVTVNSQPSAPVGTYNDTVSISISADY